MSGSTMLSRDPQIADDITALSRQVTTEDQAERELAQLRWPSGPICPFCGGRDTYALNLRTVNRRRYKCCSCRRQFSVTKGTILEGSKLSLGRWILLIQLLCEHGRDLSVNEVSRELCVSHRTARNALDRLAYASRREPFSAVLKRQGEG
jgi:transposase-like protein